MGCARGWRIVLLAALISGVFLGVPRMSHAASAPTFGPLSLEVGEDTTSTQADTARAVIKPEGSLTEYEVWIEGPREGFFCQVQVPCAPIALIGSGDIEASVKEENIDAHATGLKGARFYTWWVIARNSDGVAESESSIFETQLPLPVNEINTYHPEQPAGIAEWDQRSSELAVAEYRAAQKVKAEQEQVAREATQRAAQPAPAAPQCVVPSLTGHSLIGARRLLAQAHCELGHVSYPRRRRGTLHIARQNPAHGTHLAAESKVSIRLLR